MKSNASNTVPVALTAAERERMFNSIYSKTHSDMKGHFDGAKTLMSYAKFGGGLTSLSTISDEELRDRYEPAVRSK